MSFYFASVNRNKRSVTLDLKRKEALDILYRLAKESDVLYAFSLEAVYVYQSQRLIETQSGEFYAGKGRRARHRI